MDIATDYFLLQNINSSNNASANVTNSTVQASNDESLPNTPEAVYSYNYCVQDQPQIKF